MNNNIGQKTLYKKNFNTLSLPELGKNRSISETKIQPLHLNLSEVQTPEKAKLIQKKIIKANSTRKK